MHLPAGIAEILKTLENAGFSAFLVGGCVRDMLMEIPPSDFDIAASALPQEIASLFGASPGIGAKFGTVCVSCYGENAEITTFRKESGYSDSRHPDGVIFTSDILEDLVRRDFTCNAAAYSPSLGLIDPFFGKNDIESGILRCVGIPDARFREDPLRILRGLRFLSKCGFAADPMTDAAIHACKNTLASLSGERFLAQLMGILMGRNVTSVLLSYADVLAVQIPEILPCLAFSQHSRHHDFTVWEHIAHAVGNAAPIPEVRLAMLFHDIGKPRCCRFDSRGGHFKGHAEESARMADKILRRLHCDSSLRETVLTLIRHHREIPADLPEMRRLYGQLGRKMFPLYTEVIKADDISKQKDRPFFSERLQNALDLAEKCPLLCCCIRDLDISGADLGHLGFQGKEIGELLENLLSEVIAEKIPNKKDALLQRAAAEL